MSTMHPHPPDEDDAGRAPRQALEEALYEIKRVIVGPDGKNAKQEVFASGWLEGDQGYLGRPADIVLAKDGSILVADDWAGAIYRISYSKK